MQIITLEIWKKAVYNKVAQHTSYVGGKMMDVDAGAYERVRTIDEDESELERFWEESCSDFGRAMAENLRSDTAEAGGHRFELELPDNFDLAIVPTMERDVISFFVLNIVAKWFTISNKGEAGSYKEGAESVLTGIVRSTYRRKRPTRPTYND